MDNLGNKTSAIRSRARKPGTPFPADSKEPSSAPHGKIAIRRLRTFTWIANRSLEHHAVHLAESGPW